MSEHYARIFKGQMPDPAGRYSHNGRKPPPLFHMRCDCGYMSEHLTKADAEYSMTEHPDWMAKYGAKHEPRRLKALVDDSVWELAAITVSDGNVFIEFESDDLADVMFPLDALDTKTSEVQ